MKKLETPPTTPPLEGRGVATALSDGNDGAAAPLPSRGGVGGGVCNFLMRKLPDSLFYSKKSALPADHLAVSTLAVGLQIDAATGLTLSHPAT